MSSTTVPETAVDENCLKVIPRDIEKLRGRRIRIFPDLDDAGQNAAIRIGQALATLAAEVQIFDFVSLNRDDGKPVKDLFDLTRIDYDDFEANRCLWSITDLDSKGERENDSDPNLFFRFLKDHLKQARVSSYPSLSPSCVS